MNSKNIIISIVIVILITLGLIWLGRSSSKENEPVIGSGGDLVALAEPSFDFGSVSMAKGNVDYTFKIKNQGTDSVKIEKMYTSCMCTIASLVTRGKTFGPYGMPGHGFIPAINENIGAGEEAEIKVVFDPAAHGPAGVGKIARSIIVENSGGQLELKISATVTP